MSTFKFPLISQGRPLWMIQLLGVEIPYLVQFCSQVQFVINLNRVNRAAKLCAKQFNVYFAKTWRRMRNLARVVNQKLICVRWKFYWSLISTWHCETSLVNHKKAFKVCFLESLRFPTKLIAFKENFSFYYYFFSGFVEITKEKNDFLFDMMSMGSVTFLQLVWEFLSLDSYLWYPLCMQMTEK